jgi:hypothetical protein
MQPMKIKPTTSANRFAFRRMRLSALLGLMVLAALLAGLMPLPVGPASGKGLSV